MVHSTVVYTLEIFITSGPVTEKFIKRNPVISRTLEVRGNQTLEELHYAIFNAFDREDEHMYEFQVGGKGPNDPNAKRYGIPSAFEDATEQSRAGGYVTQTPIDALRLRIDEAFGYWFDFGDNWWHQINVISIEEKPLTDDYPKITNRIGESPPQYADFEE